MSDRLLHTIIFISSVTEILKSEEVAVIIDEERKRSNSRGLTGIAMVLGGNVLRLIEGEKDGVLEEYESVKRNPNLVNIIKLFDSASTHRYFDNYVFLSDIHSELNDYDSAEMDAYLEECFSIESREMRILKDFMKNNR